MSSQTDVRSPEAPPLAALLKTTAIALLVAAGILVTIVLPAEYGVDPLGTGRRLGLSQMSSARVTTIEAPDVSTAALAPTQNGPIGEYAGTYKYDVAELSLGPYEYVEYKYHLEKGANMVFEWTSSAPLIHDMHGEPDGGAKGSEQSFDKKNRREAHGSFTAPFGGIHGWYWENPGSATVTVKLSSAGFYASAIQIRSDRTRQPRTLKSPDTLMTGAASAGNRAQ